MTTPIRAFQWDLARQTERLDWLIRQLPRYADWGYQEVYLHLEDAVEYPSLPAIARRDAYSVRQMERLVAAAERSGIGVVPIVNLLGHTQYLIKVPELRDLNERRAPDGSPLGAGQLCPVHPRTLEVAQRLVGDVARYCTAGKLHVGLDESYALGQHPMSRREIAEIGLAGHFGRYLQRLHGIVCGCGLRMGYWADLLALLPEAIEWLPAGTAAYDWYYYPFRRRPAMELHNFREYELASKLTAKGVEYWGCPMSGPFRCEPMPTFGDRFANLCDWWRRCRRVGAAGFLVTSWETSRTGAELVQAVDAAAASLWLESGWDEGAAWSEGFGRETLARRAAGKAGCRSGTGAPGGPQGPKSEAMLASGLRRAFGPRAFARPQSAQAAARSLLAADAYAYAGYARWENESGWSAAAGRADESERRVEADFFGRRAGAERRLPWPPALHAAWAFRRYLAERDAFVARAAAGLWALRREAGRGSSQPGIRSGSGDRGTASKAPGPVVGGTNSRGRKATDQTWARLDADARAFAATLRVGRAAAWALWRRTRRPVGCCPNQAVVDGDAARLRAWRTWCARARRNPRQIWTIAPVGGAWQFVCRIHQFAPALQQVALQRRSPSGKWEDIATRFTVEFTATGACRRATIIRPFTAPLGNSADRLRLAVRGVGQVGLSDAIITDGVATIRAKGWLPGRRRTLGQPAPPKGFPALDWTINAGAVILEFNPPAGSVVRAIDLGQNPRRLRERRSSGADTIIRWL